MTAESLPHTDQLHPAVHRILLFGGALFGMVALAVLAFAVFQPVQVLPRIRLAPGYSFVRESGERLTSEDLRGQIVLYNFTYTRCPPPCGGLNGTLQEIMARVDAANAARIPFTVVTISLDPAHDTPAQLAVHAQAAGADPARWIFATNPDEELLKQVVGGGFEVFYRPDSAGMVDYEPAFVLVDGWGVIRGEYHYQTLSPDAERIVRHVNVLFDEIENSVGAARYAYEAAHLFLCYAR